MYHPPSYHTTQKGVLADKWELMWTTSRVTQHGYGFDSLGMSQHAAAKNSS